MLSLSERWTDDGEPDGIAGVVEFRTDVFDAASIDTLIERLQRVLVAITADPQRRLAVGGSARRTGACPARRAWQPRGADAGRPDEGSLPALFAAQVARTPDAVALVCDGRSLTYRELDEASNRLAHLLADRGAGPGQPVALLFSRSAEAIVAILAVLKTGAAYLPVDPALPSARIGFMLADAAPVVALTTAEYAGRLEEFELALVDVDDPAIDALSQHSAAGAGSR